MFYMNSDDPRGGGLPDSKNAAGVSWEPELFFFHSLWEHRCHTLFLVWLLWLPKLWDWETGAHPHP